MPRSRSDTAQNGRSTKQLTPSMFFFGPESEKQIPEPREPVLRPSSSHRAPTPETTLTVPRKRAGENGPTSASEGTPQPVQKRSRKTVKETSGERNGVPARKTSGATPAGPPAMDLETMNGHAPSVQDARSPSNGPAYEEEQMPNGVRHDDHMDVDSDEEQPLDAPAEVIPPLIPTLTHGESIGVQVAPAKIADLGPSTSILDVPNNQPLSQTLWKPQDQQTITARGDTVCGVWRARTNFREFVPVRPSDGTLVTALAWEPEGRALAVATYSDNGGELHLYQGQDFGLLETLPAAQRPIIKLQWHTTGMRLVGLAPFDEQSGASSIVLWDLSDATSSSGPMSVAVPETLEDVDCALADGNGFAFATGGEAVYQCRAYSELEVEQKYSSFPTGTGKWSFVKCSWRHQNDTLLVAASSETGRIWLPDRDIRKEAHQAAITGLQIRPQPLNGRPALSTNEFATSSEDGTIKIWQYDRAINNVNTVSKLTLGFPHLLKALSYSPDGFCLAGASYGIVRIWNAEHGYNQMANWEGDEVLWKGNSLKDDDLVSNGAMSSINGEGAGSGTDHSLSWDSDSKKLAFALGSQVCSLTRVMSQN